MLSLQKYLAFYTFYMCAIVKKFRNRGRYINVLSHPHCHRLPKDTISHHIVEISGLQQKANEMKNDEATTDDFFKLSLLLIYHTTIFETAHPHFYRKTVKRNAVLEGKPSFLCFS